MNICHFDNYYNYPFKEIIEIWKRLTLNDKFSKNKVYLTLTNFFTARFVAYLNCSCLLKKKKNAFSGFRKSFPLHVLIGATFQRKLFFEIN